MNYVRGDEGEYGASSPVIVKVDPSHPNHIAIADAQLLFMAEFRRAGPDLVLTGHDGLSHCELDL